MSDFNPYQAPSEAAVTPALGMEGLWRVDAGVLRFRDGAQLPEIDIRTGRSDMPLTPASNAFPVRGVMGGILPMFLRILLLCGVFGGVFLALSKGYVLSTAWVLIIFSILFVVIGMVSQRARQKVRLRWWVQAEAEAKSLKRKRWAARFSLLATVLLITSIFNHGLVPSWLGWSALGISWIVTIIVNRMARPLVCLPGRDGWFQLGGLSPEALQELAARQSGEMERWLQRPTRVRRVFTTYLYRSPLLALAGKQAWNPIVLVILILYKLTKSKLLIRDCFASDESEEIKSAEWDPELRAQWDALQKNEAFQGWRLLTSRKLDSPQGDLLTQWISLVSPGGEHSLVFALVRLSNARTTQQVLETTLRTWMDDGRLFLTSNSILQRPLPAHYEVAKRTGPPHHVLAAHLRRVEGMKAALAEFPAGWETRMTEEVEARHECLEAAGVYGPIREEHFVDTGAL